MDENSYAVEVLSNGQDQLEDLIEHLTNEESSYLSDDLKSVLMDRAKERLEELDKAIEILTTTK